MQEQAPLEMEVQRVGELTVTREIVEGREWWVWRTLEGRQLHAGLDSRQLVVDTYYRLVAGVWVREEEARCVS